MPLLSIAIPNLTTIVPVLAGVYYIYLFPTRAHLSGIGWQHTITDSAKCSTLESNPKQKPFIARLKVFSVCNSISFPRNTMTLSQTWLLNINRLLAVEATIRYRQDTSG